MGIKAPCAPQNPGGAVCSRRKGINTDKQPRRVVGTDRLLEAIIVEAVFSRCRKELVCGRRGKWTLLGGSMKASVGRIAAKQDIREKG